jgi:hypothetical protein
MSTIRDIPTALLTVTPRVYHFEEHGRDYPYIVWAEETSPAALMADDRQRRQAIRGSIRYYTRDEYDTTVNAIQRALIAARISFRLSSIQHIQNAGAIEYLWDWEVVCGEGELY